MFRAEVFINQQISNYESKPNDLNYPNKLLQLSSSSLSPPSPEAYLHPVLRATLTILSRLYRCIEANVFQVSMTSFVFLCIPNLKIFGKASLPTCCDFLFL